MSFYPCFWAVLLLTSLVCVALDGVELLKKWAENMKVVIFSVKWGNEWLPHVAKGRGQNRHPVSKGVHFLDTLWMYCATGSFWRMIGTPNTNCSKP